MAYTKQTWADLPSKTTPINAERLTHIEDGIYSAAQTADTAASTAGTASANVGIVSSKVETLTERVNGLDTAVSNKVDNSKIGAANGVAGLDNTGRVPSSQLPSYVDDVLEYASLSAFPVTGEAGKIYVALDTNKTYRWSGSAYVEISESLALGETQGTAYEGSKGKANADAIAAIQGTINGLGTASTKNSTSIITESSDLVESGAVKDIVGWGNKNLLDCRLETLKALNTHGTWNGNVFTRAGIEYTVNDDLTITANGTCSSNNSLMYLTDNGDLGLVGKHYGVEASLNDVYGAYITSSAPTISVPSEGVVIPSEVGNTYRLGIRVFHDQTINNVVFKPMVCDNNLSDKTYEPYHAPISECLDDKCDNSVIAPVENGSTASQAYAVGEHFIRDGAFCTCKQAISQGGTLTENTNYVSGDVANLLSPIDATISLTDATLFSSIKNVVRKYGNVVEIFFECVLDTDKSLAAWDRIGLLANEYKPNENTYTIAFIETTGSGKVASKVLFVSQTGAVQCALGLSAGDRLMFQCTFIQK